MKKVNKKITPAFLLRLLSPNFPGVKSSYSVATLPGIMEEAQPGLHLISLVQNGVTE